ncbi:MAG: exo-alpha-sialidase, partial [Bacteroidales bacterium]|nr:exo-alpha-sialidase [Bacteroidales bacterium]
MKNPVNFSTLCIIFLLLTTLTYSQTIDYGDAPDPKYPNLSIIYPTLIVNGGASHQLDQSTFLGTLCDAELDGQPHPHAQGDDNLGVNDDDGVAFTSLLTPGSLASVFITASVSGFLNAWIDFNFNGSWADPGEQIFIDASLGSGANTLVFTVPGTAVNSISYARFRFSLLGGISFNGPAPDGEVEDYEVIIGEPYDFGDAPDPNYPTLALNNGAAHLMDGITYMGIDVDAEPDGQPVTNAVGDDQDGNDDNDGVVFNSWLDPGFNASVIVIASVAGFLDAWIDYNNDGDWADAGEQIFTSTPLGAGYNNLTFLVDATAATGLTYTRFRFSSTGGLTPTGLAPDGEVEDYQLFIGFPIIFPGIIIDPDPTYKHVQNEISLTLLLNTSCGDVLAAAYNDHPYAGGPGLGISYNHSNTGGIWNNTHLAYPQNPYGGCQFLDAFDPTITKDSYDNLYAAFISSSFYWNPAPATGIYVCKSTDYGVSWGAPVTVATNGYPTSNPDANYRFNDRCQITADIYPVSNHYNNIYLVWIKDRGLNQPLPYGDIYFSRSTDAGVTFSQEITLNNPSNNMGNMPIPTVAKDGTLYVCWVDCDVTIQTGDPNADMRFNVSSDGGVTWGTDTFIATFDLPPRNLNNLLETRVFGASVIRAHPSNPNILYIVYAADPDGAGADESDIYFIKSTDGGTSWSSTPIRVNDDNTTYDQILPWMEVKPNGIIDIAWYDRRNDPLDVIWDVYFSNSTDGGNSFSTNIPISQAPFTTPNTPLSGRWMGEYLGLAVDYPIAHSVHTTDVFDPLGDICWVITENPELDIDWGDAPDPTYPTQFHNNGARHTIDNITYLGQTV